MSIAVKIPVLMVVGYLLGTIPSAVWVARSHGLDIYEVGSGNPGASNIYRALGKKAAATVFLMDALKGVVPTAAGRWALGGTVALGLFGGAAAVAGHSWPVFRRFKGGRGVATGAGVLIVCYPILVLILLALFALTVAITKKPSVGSLVAILGVVVGMAVIWPSLSQTLLVLALVILVLARHSGNIKRLFRGEEHGLELERGETTSVEGAS